MEIYLEILEVLQSGETKPTRIMTKTNMAWGQIQREFKDMEEKYGGMWDFEIDPIKAAQKMIEHIDKKRKALGIDKARERVLYDMEMRRELEG